MHSLNDIICGITKDDNLDISLWEDNGSEISDVLIKNKLNYNIIDKNDKLPQGNILILFLKDSDLEKYYGYIGRLLLIYQNRFIVIRKLNTKSYINGTHNMIMSLGFNIIFKFKENNLFYCFYVYNISNYKKTPDWLNNENWANPELWEK